MKEVFDRGFRLDEQTQGTGLGLNIVKDAVEIFSGSVWIEKSKFNKFFLLLFVLRVFIDKIKPVASAPHRMVVLLLRVVPAVNDTLLKRVEVIR